MAFAAQPAATRKTMLVLALMVSAFVGGAGEGWIEEMRGSARTVLLLSEVLVYTVLILAWIHIDSIERGYARSRLLNVGIIALALVFVPVYLIRSRPRGTRAKALRGFLLGSGGFVLAAFCGGLLGELVRG